MRELNMNECNVISGGGYMSYADIETVCGLLSPANWVLVASASLFIGGIFLLYGLSQAN